MYTIVRIYISVQVVGTGASVTLLNFFTTGVSFFSLLQMMATEAHAENEQIMTELEPGAAKQKLISAMQKVKKMEYCLCDHCGTEGVVVCIRALSCALQLPRAYATCRFNI